MKDADKTIGNLIDHASVSIIGSVDEAGFPNAKAMLPPRKRVGIKHIYFTTNLSSMRVRQFTDNPKACVYFFDKRFYRGVMLRGTMKVLKDSRSKKMIWRDGDELYYKRRDRPRLLRSRFTAENGRYYHNFKSEDFEV